MTDVFGHHTGALSETDTHTLFGQTMGYVAATAGLFARGAYLGRDLSYGWGWAWYIAAFICLISMNFAAKRSSSSAVVLLFAFGLMMGLATAPTLVYYAELDPQVLWQAAGATALFIAGFGTWGYATQEDLSWVGRVGFFALLGLIIFGIVMIFVNIPDGDVIYCVLGLVIFAGITMADFQRLRLSKGIDSAPLMAASIFLDILNVFLFFLQLFSGNRDR